ncbi:MAG: tyrosine-type recombinase/integrase [Pirellulaceae bacterium]
MEWTDPTTGKIVSKSTGKTNTRQAHKVAIQTEQELRDGTYGRDYTPWPSFRDRYLEEAFIGKADDSRDKAASTLNLVESLIDAKSVQALNENAIAKFRSRLLQKTIGKVKRPITHATVNRHLRTLRAALAWAHKRGLLHRVPLVEMLPNMSGKAKGRPITGEEFERMLTATEKVVDGARSQQRWKQFLRALWASGMRIGEALKLQWHDGPIHVDISSKRPTMRFKSNAQKNRKDQVVPVVPEFWAVLNEVPPEERAGFVFDVSAERVHVGKKSFAVNARRVETIGRVITEIGRRAHVRVNETGKPASAHDLRRSFGDRWAAKVVPTVLMRLMRHANIQTTMAFYATGEIDSISEVVWGCDNARLTDTSTDTMASNGLPAEAHNTGKPDTYDNLGP